MKKHIIEDTYVFADTNPSFNEVTAKLEELKKLGWKELAYEKGIKCENSYSYDTYDIQARISGMRKPEKKDIKVNEQWHNNQIKETKEYIKEIEDKIKTLIKELDKEKLDLKKQLKDKNKDLTKIKKAL